MLMVSQSRQSGQTIGLSNCIAELDAFNSLESGTFTQVGLTNGPAEPEDCQAANGNGVTNCKNDPNTPLVGGTINCGPK
jgi:hypothetical protein